MAASEPNIVVALVSGYYGVGDKSVVVMEGDVFRASDPVVKKYPKVFGPQGSPTDHVIIEQATAAPGEKR